MASVKKDKKNIEEKDEGEGKVKWTFYSFLVLVWNYQDES